MSSTPPDVERAVAPRPHDPQLYALVLAAGSASRYGSPKQLAHYQGTALVTRSVRLAERLCADRSVLVTGFAGREVHAACAPLRGFTVYNEDYPQGLGTSIARGVAVLRGVADGVLLLLADQPLVTLEHLRALEARWRAQPERAVASRYAGSVGVPAILPAADFEALLALAGDSGAKAIIEAHGSGLITLDFAAAATDIDRPQDLAALH
ncbi:MAG: nucleotidyltransferase family protein [Woeseia sp.]